jgi:hypothetical protein
MYAQKRQQTQSGETVSPQLVQDEGHQHGPAIHPRRTPPVKWLKNQIQKIRSAWKRSGQYMHWM